MNWHMKYDNPVETSILWSPESELLMKVIFKLEKMISPKRRRKLMKKGDKSQIENWQFSTKKGSFNKKLMI